ncbi:MAG TPA: dephospho-CoA kinase, partial [Candidatus Omnitrophota bacterium]|nr:dephospho-CoA kinase [Candidatus Omnitrophota bacterium]
MLIDAEGKFYQISEQGGEKVLFRLTGKVGYDEALNMIYYEVVDADGKALSLEEIGKLVSGSAKAREWLTQAGWMRAYNIGNFFMSVVVTKTYSDPVQQAMHDAKEKVKGTVNGAKNWVKQKRVDSRSALIEDLFRGMPDSLQPSSMFHFRKLVEVVEPKTFYVEPKYEQEKIELVPAPIIRYEELKPSNRGTNPAVLILKAKKDGAVRIIGITGPVASGKSEAARYLSSRGYAHVEVDQISRDLSKHAPDSLREELIAEFGIEIININGGTNKAIAFKSNDSLARYERIMVPFVAGKILEEVDRLIRAQAKVIFIDSALLHKFGIGEVLDEVWYVVQEEERRNRNIYLRDAAKGVSAEATRLSIERLKETSPSHEEYSAMATRTIDNNGTKEELFAQLDRLMVQGANAAVLIEEIKEGGELMALVGRVSVELAGRFIPLTQDEKLPLQIAINQGKKGDKGKFVHYHTPAPDQSAPRQEILYVISGQIKALVYTLEGKLVEERIVNAGEFVLFAQAHNIEFMEDSKILEVKQGPYPGMEKDKVVLTGISGKNKDVNSSVSTKGVFAQGDISQVFFNFVPISREEDPDGAIRIRTGGENYVFGVYAALETALRGDPRIQAIVLLTSHDCERSRATEQDVRRYLNHVGIKNIDQRVIFVKERFNAELVRNLYIRDLFVIKDPKTILIPKEFDGSEKKPSVTAFSDVRKMAAALGMRVEQSSLIFEGGDLVFAGRTLYISSKALLSNIRGYSTYKKGQAITAIAPYTEKQRQAVKAAFRKEFGVKKVVIIGEGVLEKESFPFFHLDTFLVPVSEDSVLLLDARQGCELISRTLAEHPEELDQAEQEFYAQRDRVIAAGVFKTKDMLEREYSYDDEFDV